MLSPESKATIDTLNLVELEAEVAKGRTSRFQNDNHDYIKVRLAKLLREQQDANITKNHQLAEEANQIAKEANATAIGLKTISKLALGISVVSIFVTVLTILIPHWWK